MVLKSILKSEIKKNIVREVEDEINSLEELSDEDFYYKYFNEIRGKRPNPASASIEEIFGFPKVDCDVYENEDVLVSRLFYVIPDIFEVKLRVFIFYEENTFLKDSKQNLKLIQSNLKIQYNKTEYLTV